MPVPGPILIRRLLKCFSPAARRSAALASDTLIISCKLFTFTHHGGKSYGAKAPRHQNDISKMQESMFMDQNERLIPFLKRVIVRQLMTLDEVQTFESEF
jgi:hypothetical protein